MPVKYQCPKCGRRFAEWGAEKFGFTCPADDQCPEGAADEQIELVRVGTDDTTAKKQVLKRFPKRSLASVDALGSPTTDDEDVTEFGDDPDVQVSADVEDAELEDDVVEGDEESGEDEEEA